MLYRCELIEQPAQKVVSIRTRTPVYNLPQVMGIAYHSIMQYLSEIAEYPSGVPFAAYYNMDMQDLDVEIGFPVAKTLEGNSEIKPGEIPAGQHASCIHVGPYSQVEPAYQALTQWMNESGHTPSGIAYEFYLNDPAETPENELQTRIMFSLL
ncbi:MAG TPA: GyrI-like domain-containing protein [Syntrophomonadaceae bacterium]|nr:GyrI-like domain-containing protein [Syntrophomonadaceae bacterium]